MHLIDLHQQGNLILWHTMSQQELSQFWQRFEIEHEKFTFFYRYHILRQWDILSIQSTTTKSAINILVCWRGELCTVCDSFVAAQHGQRFRGILVGAGIWESLIIFCGISQLCHGDSAGNINSWEWMKFVFRTKSHWTVMQVNHRK